MKINGRTVRLEAVMTLEAYLGRENYALDKIVVEYNGRILPREEYGLVMKEEDVVEILTFMGGG